MDFDKPSNIVPAIRQIIGGYSINTNKKMLSMRGNSKEGIVKSSDCSYKNI
jgi:hypothetical protein